MSIPISASQILLAVVVFPEPEGPDRNTTWLTADRSHMPACLSHQYSMDMA
jgi:hypothetical protein